jgi:DNA-binding NarL/FixJ family response regulator
VVSSGLSYREIARIAGTSEGNVKVMVHRARVKLKKNHRCRCGMKEFLGSVPKSAVVGFRISQ